MTKQNKKSSSHDIKWGKNMSNTFSKDEMRMAHMYTKLCSDSGSQAAGRRTHKPQQGLTSPSQNADPPELKTRCS